MSTKVKLDIDRLPQVLEIRLPNRCHRVQGESCARIQLEIPPSVQWCEVKYMFMGAIHGEEHFSAQAVIGGRTYSYEKGNCALNPMEPNLYDCNIPSHSFSFSQRPIVTNPTRLYYTINADDGENHPTSQWVNHVGAVDNSHLESEFEPRGRKRSR